MGIKIGTKWRLVVPLLGVLSTLGGCADQTPKASADEAWIGLKVEPTTSVMAGTVDGKQLDDGRFFEVSAGKHTLGATLFVEGEGDSNGATCNASVTYQDFKAGKHYTLVESSLGQEYKVTLYNASDKPLAHSADVNCMAG